MTRPKQKMCSEYNLLNVIQEQLLTSIEAKNYKGLLIFCFPTCKLHLSFIQMALHIACKCRRHHIGLPLSPIVDMKEDKTTFSLFIKLYLQCTPSFSVMILWYNMSSLTPFPYLLPLSPNTIFAPDTVFVEPRYAWPIENLRIMKS